MSLHTPPVNKIYNMADGCSQNQPEPLPISREDLLWLTNWVLRQSRIVGTSSKRSKRCHDDAQAEELLQTSKKLYQCGRALEQIAQAFHL